MRTIEFDENDGLDNVLAAFRKECQWVTLDEAERSTAEDLIRAFHSDLLESARFGNQMRLEKSFGRGRAAVRVVAVSSQQRGYLTRFLAKLTR